MTPSSKLHVATRKGLFTLEPGRGDAWEITGVDHLAIPVSAVLQDSRDQTLYAALEHGHFGPKLHRRKAGGPWEEIQVPRYPERPADAEPERDIMGRTIEWKLRSIWTLEPGSSDQPGRLWAGTLPGGLFRSDDHGDSWQLVESLWHDPRRQQWMGGGSEVPALHSISIDPRDPKRLALGVSCAGVWHTADDGASWEPHESGMRAAYMPEERQFDPLAQDPHRLARCAAAPDVIWCQHHNGIFKSTDAGRNWTEIEKAGPSTFGFAVAVHPEDPDTAWFVPADKDERRVPVNGSLVVTRTRDGGRSFEELRTGLPQRHAYDLVLRHALDVSADGRSLAFGSTTGNLWLSADGGDHWTTACPNLPPIHAVRFA